MGRAISEIFAAPQTTERGATTPSATVRLKFVTTG